LEVKIEINHLQLVKSGKEAKKIQNFIEKPVFFVFPF